MRLRNLKSASKLAALCVATGLWASAAAAADLRLIMFEQEGCHWCERWEADVGKAYHKTEEAKIAPLTRLHLREPVPEDIELAQVNVLTPTFVVLQDGSEVGRITGYPGEDFFWGLLDMIFEKIEAENEAAQ